MGESGLRKPCSGCKKGRTDRYGQVWLQGLSHKVSVVNHRMGTIIPRVLGMEQLVLLELPGTSAFYSRGNRGLRGQNTLSKVIQGAEDRPPQGRLDAELLPAFLSIPAPRLCLSVLL